MTKKKIVLIGLICLLLIGGATAVLSSKSGAPEEAISPKSPEKVKAVEQPVKQPVKEPSPQAIEITVAQLFTEYDTNEISADQKYLNKTLRVSGEVNKIDRDISTGKAGVILEGQRGKYNRVFVYFVFNSETEVASLSKGQKVTLEGKCVGRRLEGIVRLINSSLVK